MTPGVRLRLVHSVQRQPPTVRDRAVPGRLRSDSGLFHGAQSRFVDRRAVLRLGAAAGVGILLPWGSGCTPAGQEAALGLVRAAILLFATTALEYALREKLGGRISLENTTGDYLEGGVGFHLMSSAGDSVASGLGSYEIDAFTVNEYEWSGLRADTPGVYQAMAESALSSVTSELLRVRG